MKYLFGDWEIVQNRIYRAQPLYLFLDYDGTLTPIVARPELALCPPEVKVLLEKLRERPNVWVAIISGRSLEDIHAKVGVSGITYVGNHGLEIENPAGTHRKKLSLVRVKELRKIRKTLEKTLQSIPGILFEDKGPILTVHHRNSPPEYSVQVQKVVKEVLERWKDGWQIAWGEKYWRFGPGWISTKGKLSKSS
ncbi:MAG: trehalose-phosphatase [Thermodesulfobacteriota bacterium]